MRRRWKPTIPAVAAIIAMSTIPVGVTGCASSEPQVTTGAPPTVICGTVLNNSAAGAVVYDATRQLPTVKHTTVGGLLILRVARGCDEGTRVSWTPSSAAHLLKAARAKDGQTVAVVLEPTRPGAAFRLVATRNGQVVASARVKLAS